MSLESNVNAALLANKAKRDAAVAPVVPVTPVSTGTETQTGNPNITNIQTPVIQSPTAESATNKEAVPPASVPAIKPSDEKPKKDETSKLPTEVVEEEFRWDANIPDTSATPEPISASADLKKLGSAFNLDVKTEDEFISKVNEKLSKLKDLEAFDGLPEQLRQAAEIAKKGGDWLAYTGAAAFDASKLDPLELFQKEYERTEVQNFKKEDGSVDWEKLDEAHDSIPEAVRRMQGNQIKGVITARQQQQQTVILAQAAAQQDKFKTSLSEAARDLPNLLPRDQFGITIEPKHSSYLYEGMINGNLIKKHLGNISQADLMRMDGKKLMKTLAIAEFGEGISQARYKQGEVAGRKSLLISATNPQLQTPSYSPRPNDPNDESKPSSTELLKNMNDRQKPKNSL